jgi:hypothetical protein
VALLTQSLTLAIRSLHFFLFTVPTANGVAQSSDELVYRLTHAMTSTLLRPRPNSRPKDRFPTINFWIEALQRLAHGDRKHHGQSSAFPMIYEVLAQLDGSVSIKSKQGCQNKNAAGEIGPELGWPWQGLSAAFLRDLGEIQNWSSLVIDWGHGLGGLVLDYPTELTVASIYSRQERWPLNWTTTRGGRRSGRSLAQGIRGIYRGSPHRRWSDSQSESRRCGECAQVRGSRPWSGCHRRAHPKRPWQARYGGWSISTMMILTQPRVLSSRSERESRWWRHESARGSSAARDCAGSLIRSLYHGIHLQLTWQSNLELDFLLISCNNPIIPLHRSYSPINQLQSCYGGHAQTCAGSCSNLGSKIASSHCQTRFSLQTA